MLTVGGPARECPARRLLTAAIVPGRANACPEASAIRRANCASVPLSLSPFSRCGSRWAPYAAGSSKLCHAVPLFLSNVVRWPPSALVSRLSAAWQVCVSVKGEHPAAPLARQPVAGVVTPGDPVAPDTKNDVPPLNFKLTHNRLETPFCFSRPVAIAPTGSMPLGAISKGPQGPGVPASRRTARAPAASPAATGRRVQVAPGRVCSPAVFTFNTAGPVPLTSLLHLA